MMHKKYIFSFKIVMQTHISLYLEGLGNFFGLIYFCHELSQNYIFGIIKILSFLFSTLFYVSPSREFILVPCLFLFVMDQLWNIFILFDILNVLYDPSNYQGLIWSADKETIHRLLNEKPMTHQLFLLEFFGYFFYYFLVIYFYGLCKIFSIRFFYLSRTSRFQSDASYPLAVSVVEE